MRVQLALGVVAILLQIAAGTVPEVQKIDYDIFRRDSARGLPYEIREMMLPMRDGVRLYTRIHLPKGLSGRTGAVFARSPYSRPGGAFGDPAIAADIGQAPATVWVSSLDGAEIGKSRRMLLTHLPDVLQTDTTFEKPDRRIMLSWGRLPFLMRRAKAKVTLKAGPRDFEVWALRHDGTRLRKVPSRRTENGHLSFALDTASNPGTATWLYEIVAGEGASE